MKTNGVLYLAAVVVVVVGCRSMDPTAFADFQRSLTTLQADVDQATATPLQEERAALLAGLVAGEITPDRISLQLQDGDPGWALPARPADRSPLPPYYDWKLTRGRLQQASQAMLDYAGMLLALAKTDPLSKSEAEALQGHLNSLAVQGKATPGKALKEQAGIISAVAVEGFQAYLRHRRAADLRRAVQANAPAFNEYLRTVGDLVGQLRANLRRHHLAASEDLLAGWPAGKPVAEAKAKQLLALNDETIDRLELLTALAAVIDTLPAAHAALASADPDAAGTLQALAAATERLDQLVGSRKGAKTQRIPKEI